ncbi:MAG: PEPxxWA-CTERM sorting domain-containing protein [Phenylobacterium sp.]|uniref:PEPxxWA-CTERM sorting domain-containing protein n=1 Tax=Phenylobacterium sp. TaxID=1871053 RepID=UPI00391AE28D
MKKLMALAAMAAALLFGAAAPAAADTDFEGSHSVTLNNSDPGLVVHSSPINTNFSFTLAEGGSQTISLFSLYTLESAINADDLTPKPIEVLFGFTLPVAFGGSVDGSTVGWRSLTGFFQGGSVTWNGPVQLAFGNGGILEVALNNTTFNNGILWGTGNVGATIEGTFTLVQAAAIPEPGVWALMIAGFGLMGAALRRQRALGFAAA